MNKQLVFLALISAILVGGSILFALNSGNQVSSSGIQIDQHMKTLYKQWKLKYGKRFADPEQDQYRLEIFASNFEIVQADNSGTLGITKFFDLTFEEFASTYLTEGNDEAPTDEFDSTNLTSGNYQAQIPIAADLPVSTSISINWVEKGKVTAVKNQGRCGSCWAFSTTGAVESALIIMGYASKNINLSEQQLVDCDKLSGNDGCNGGNKDQGLKYVRDNGITIGAQYPYVAVDGTCQTQKIAYPIYTITDYYQVDSSTQSLANALANGPVAISVDASSWNLYTGGVFPNTNCSKYLHNHAVLLVGFQNGNWIIKNSWGPNWGEAGYIRLQNGNTCGVANIPFYPKIGY